MSPRRLFVYLATLLLIVLIATTAGAQTPTNPTVKSPATANSLEFDIGAVLLTPVSMGTQPINLTATNGSPVTLANTSSSMGTSFGIEARMGFPVTQSLSLAVTGGWSRVNFRTDVTGDTEGATSVIASTGVSRFTVGGDVEWAFARTASHQIYAVGGGSWMREVSALSASSLYNDGSIIDGGAGAKMLFKQNPQGKVKHLGLRFEGRVGVRTGGLNLDNKNTHIVPTFVASFLIGL